MDPIDYQSQCVRENLISHKEILNLSSEEIKYISKRLYDDDIKKKIREFLLKYNYDGFRVSKLIYILILTELRRSSV